MKQPVWLPRLAVSIEHKPLSQISLLDKGLNTTAKQVMNDDLQRCGKQLGQIEAGTAKLQQDIWDTEILHWWTEFFRYPHILLPKFFEQYLFASFPHLIDAMFHHDLTKYHHYKRKENPKRWGAHLQHLHFQFFIAFNDTGNIMFVICGTFLLRRKHVHYFFFLLSAKLLLFLPTSSQPSVHTTSFLCMLLLLTNKINKLDL